MKTYTFKITERGSYHHSLKAEVLEGSVEERLIEFFLVEPEPVSKRRLAFIFPHLGSHEKHETARIESSIREMQQIIHDLRKLNVPIVSGHHGCWLATSNEEINDYDDWIRRKRESDFKTYSAMIKDNRRLRGHLGFLPHLEARKHFEAVRVDIATKLNLDAADLREDIKAVLKEAKVIESSTTELDDLQLESYANKLHQYAFDIDTVPPDERRPFDLKAILLS